MLNISIKSFIKSDGERYCLLMDLTTGIPLYFPNLFITTQVRNKSLSYSSMESNLTGLSVLLRFFEIKNDDIEARFRKNDFLKESELDGLRDFCQGSFQKNNKEKATHSVTNSFVSKGFVSLQTEYMRLTVIAHYVNWLAGQLSINTTKEVTTAISKMVKGIKSRRPPKKNRNKNLNDEVKGFNSEQLELIFELFKPLSKVNPFKEHSVKVRNQLMFLMLYHLGLRRGELLNIRIRDIDFSNNQLVIVRRADEKDDPRTNQPLVKTLDRRLPLKDTLVSKIHEYIKNDRKSIPNANKNDFLFITHKSGYTQGQPISIPGYNKIFVVVREYYPGLYNLQGHKLRHTWNERFSELMDGMDTLVSEEKQEKIRSYLMGWKEGSGSAATYNHRFIKNTANKAAIELQKDSIRVPKGIESGK